MSKFDKRQGKRKHLKEYGLAQVKGGVTKNFPGKPSVGIQPVNLERLEFI